MTAKQSAIQLGQLQLDAESTAKKALAARRAFERAAAALTTAEDNHATAIHALRGGYATVAGATKLPV